jgi:hypothetical protein
MKNQPLSPGEKRRRIAALLGLAAALGAMAFFPFPFAGLISCPLRGTWGIPCLLCGATRALHALLTGDWPRALYLNGLAFPVAFGASALMFHWLREIFTGQRIPIRIVCRTRHFLFLAAALVTLWGIHLYGALATPKPELLNRGALGFRIWEGGFRKD